MIDENAIHDAPQPEPRKPREHVAPAFAQIHQWIAAAPLLLDKAQLAILLRIDAHTAWNTEVKRGSVSEPD